MQAVVNGLMTNYLKTGNGKKVVVLLHGWGDRASTFSDLAQKLGKEYTVLAPDLPGFGGTEEPRRPWGIDEYANFVVFWLEKIGTKNVYALVGHSNGGAISIALAGSGKLKPKKIILLASSGVRDIDKMRRFVLKSGAQMIKLPLHLLPKRTRERVRGRVYKSIGSDYMLLPELWASYRLIIAQDMQAAATKITQPTLLVYGTNDKTTPLKYGELFRDAIKSSKLETVEAGHMMHHHQPEAIAKLVKDFLDA